MSAVEIVRRTGLSLWIQKFDLLDGTPILDIKPYLAYADSIPHAHTGWMNYENQIFYDIIWSPESRKKLDWLRKMAIRHNMLPKIQ
jgi:tRNA (Thr-GGU) A37 N-methylase